MIRTGHFLAQRQVLQQKLSPQQIQYIKLLQLPTVALEMRIKEEIEMNPILEEITDSDSYDEEPSDLNDPADAGDRDTVDETDPVDDNQDIDWETFLHDQDSEGFTSYKQHEDEDWRDYPKPYHENLLEDLEKQVALLELSDAERVIAEQIIGSIDEDGYLRRDVQAIADAVAFNNGYRVMVDTVEFILKKIQHLDPPGTGARDLRECLLVQLELKPSTVPGRNTALSIVRDEWDNFEKKHFDKIQKRLNITDTQIKQAYDCIQTLDPKPGYGNEAEDVSGYIIPDFEVYFQPEPGNGTEETGSFVINLNSRNKPALRISPYYKQMWDNLKKQKQKKGDIAETQQFIRNKVESARWFIDSLKQRQHTLISVMSTIVALQEHFFRFGDKLKPMILKDVADRVSMDISTISRVVNGKYVQTPFGVFELKYFFNEGIETSSGEEVSNREVKDYLLELVENEDKKRPLSDDALADALKKKGYVVARRTISKYREQLAIPVARLRKAII